MLSVNICQSYQIMCNGFITFIKNKFSNLLNSDDIVESVSKNSKEEDIINDFANNITNSENDDDEDFIHIDYQN